MDEGRRALEVVLLFGEDVLDVRHVLPPKGVVIGEGKNADLFVSSDGLPSNEFPLVRSEQGKFILTFIGEQRGEIDLGGTIHPLQWFKTHQDVTPDPQLPGCFRCVLSEGSRVTLRFEGSSITLRYVSAPERLEEAPGKRDLRYAARLLTASIVLLVAFVAFALIGQQPELVEPPEIKTVDQRLARLANAPDPQPRMSFARMPLVLGLLSADDAARTLAPIQPEVQTCLAKAGATVHLSIDADGTSFVSSVVASNPKCLSEVLESVRFPPPLDGGAEIELNF